MLNIRRRGWTGLCESLWASIVHLSHPFPFKPLSFTLSFEYLQCLGTLGDIQEVLGLGPEPSFTAPCLCVDFDLEHHSAVPYNWSLELCRAGGTFFPPLKQNWSFDWSEFIEQSYYSSRIVFALGFSDMFWRLLVFGKLKHWFGVRPPLSSKREWGCCVIQPLRAQPPCLLRIWLCWCREV